MKMVKRREFGIDQVGTQQVDGEVCSLSRTIAVLFGKCSMRHVQCVLARNQPKERSCRKTYIGAYKEAGWLHRQDCKIMGQKGQDTANGFKRKQVQLAS